MTEYTDVLFATLREQRAHVVRACSGLDDDVLRRSSVPSGWSPLGMVRHLTYDVEQFWFEGSSWVGRSTSPRTTRCGIPPHGPRRAR